MKLFQNLRRVTLLLAAASLPFFGVQNSSAAITIATVPVGNVGNAADTTGYGAVGYNYNIGKYDVTAGQYAAFLNAVAKADPNGLYNANMATGVAAAGISQSGVSGSYVYTTTKDANFPVNYVSFWNSARFANWLQNGQPNGAQGPSTTEDGAYTLTAGGMSANTITRNAGNTWYVPSEDEWYKAAFYKPAGGYNLYPTNSNTQPSNVLSASGTNNANYYNGGYTDPTNYLTPVGAFAASPSAYGTFDQGGDLWQWNDAIISGSSRGLRGGSFANINVTLQSGDRNNDDPTDVYNNIGFRVSQVPEPASVAVLALSVMGLSRRRRATR